MHEKKGRPLNAFEYRNELIPFLTKENENFLIKSYNDSYSKREKEFIRLCYLARFIHISNLWELVHSLEAVDPAKARMHEEEAKRLRFKEAEVYLQLNKYEMDARDLESRREGDQ